MREEKREEENSGAKQVLSLLCHCLSLSASKGLQIDILASTTPAKCYSSQIAHRVLTQKLIQIKLK